MTTTILVTGAAGFIGSHVCAALAARGVRAVGMDNFDPFYDVARKRANVREVMAHAAGAFELIEGDICDAGTVRAVFERTRPDGVIHLAAKAGVRPSIADPVGYAHTNVTGTAVMLEEARRAKCSRIVVASSSSVYGNGAKVPFSEDFEVGEPISPYAATKRACELICYTHWHLTKMPTACLRFFTVFGPRQRPDLAIQSFMTKISRGEEITVFGDGSMSRDFTFIDDIVRGVLAAYDRVSEFGYRVWNLGGNKPKRVDEMVSAIEAVVGKKANVKRAPVQPGDVERTWADLTRASRELGFGARVSFEDGLKRQWEWNRTRGD